ncbi:MAG: DUF63 family protein [Candidatus Nanohaloarchaea archaeon]
MLSEVKRFLVAGGAGAGDWTLSSTAAGVALLLLAFYMFLKLLERTGLEPDRQLLFYSTPFGAVAAFFSVKFSLIGGAAAGVFAALAALGVSLKLEEALDCSSHRVYLLLGVLGALPGLLFLNTGIAGVSAAVFLPFAASTVLLSAATDKDLMYALGGQYFDASTSFAVLSAGGVEVHVFGNLFVRSFGPQGIFVLKSAVVLPAALYLARSTSGRRKTLYMFFIGILGFSVGLANLFRA